MRDHMHHSTYSMDWEFPNHSNLSISEITQGKITAVFHVRMYLWHTVQLAKGTEYRKVNHLRMLLVHDIFMKPNQFQNTHVYILVLWHTQHSWVYEEKVFLAPHKWNLWQNIRNIKKLLFRLRFFGHKMQNLGSIIGQIMEIMRKLNRRELYTVQ